MHGWHATSTWWPCLVAKFSWGKCYQTPLDLRGYARISHSAPLTWSIFRRHYRVPIFEWILLFRKLIWWVATYIHKVLVTVMDGYLYSWVLQYYKKGLETLLWAPPPVCLPSLCHITVQNLPGLSPPFLYTVSDQKLDGEKVWEQGYTYPMSTSTSMYLHICWP